MNTIEMLKLQAEGHWIIDTERFSSKEEYVLHLMHQSDYEKAGIIAKDLRVLDLGCNCGYGTYHLSNSSKTVIGVDISEKAIAAAQCKFIACNMQFRLVNGITLPFEDDQFDMVTSFQVLEHIPDYNAHFQEIIRVIRDDGLLIIATPNAAIRLLPGMKPWNPFHVREFNSNELRDLLTQYFCHVRLIGDFAEKELYEIEYRRCTRKRDRTDVTWKRKVKDNIKGMLPSRMLSGMHKMKCNVNNNRKCVEDFMGKYNTDHFYYKEIDLESSLNLVAICSNNTEQAEEAAQIYLRTFSH